MGVALRGPIYLLDYSQGTFARASEAAFVDPRLGWAFAAQGAGAWKGANAPRIYADGAVLIESSRTNTLADSEDANTQWNPTATRTQNVGGDPDGGSDADEWELSASAGVGSGGLWRSASGPTAAAGPYAFSSYARQIAGADVNYKHRAFDGSARVFDASLLPEWRRLALGWTSGGGGVQQCGGGTYQDSTNGLPYGAKTVRVWGNQLEAGAFPSSYIRTAGASATRAAESSGVQFAIASLPSVITTGRWAIDVWPLFGSDDQYNASAYVYQFTGNAGLLFRRAGGVQRLARFNSAGGVDGSELVVTFSRHQKLTIITDEAEKTLSVQGATTGNGTVSFTQAIAGNTTITFGCHAGVATREANSVISRPRAA